MVEGAEWGGFWGLLTFIRQRQDRQQCPPHLHPCCEQSPGWEGSSEGLLTPTWSWLLPWLLAEWSPRQALPGSPQGLSYQWLAVTYRLSKGPRSLLCPKPRCWRPGGGGWTHRDSMLASSLPYSSNTCNQSHGRGWAGLGRAGAAGASHCLCLDTQE